MIYNLENRTIEFSKMVIRFCKKIKPTNINSNIINQLIRSATSVGANYREANGASSKKDFHNKIYICKKEIQETKYWLELFKEAESNHEKELSILWKESHELTLIFGKISSSVNSKKSI